MKRCPGTIALGALLAVPFTIGDVIPSPHMCHPCRDQSVGWLLSYEPELVRAAAEKGIWPGMVPGEEGESHSALSERTQAEIALADFANPYFQHGDFDRDGLCDLAILVIERSSRRRGVAIVPGRLDKVHLIGVGRAVPPEQSWRITGLRVDHSQGEEIVLISRGSEPGIGTHWTGDSFSTYVLDEPLAARGEPELLTQAREKGLWPAGIRYEILWETNPAYLRGDFNGDGQFDVAVLVRDTSNREKGIVVIPSTADTLHTLFPGTLPETDRGGITNPTRILLIPKGRILRPFPEPVEREPITLTGDAIWAGWPGAPYTGAWYFRAGRFHWVTLSD